LLETSERLAAPHLFAPIALSWFQDGSATAPEWQVGQRRFDQRDGNPLVPILAHPWGASAAAL